MARERRYQLKTETLLLFDLSSLTARQSGVSIFHLNALHTRIFAVASK